MSSTYILLVLGWSVVLCLVQLRRYDARGSQMGSYRGLFPEAHLAAKPLLYILPYFDISNQLASKINIQASYNTFRGLAGSPKTAD